MAKTFEDLMVEFVGEYKKNFSNLFSLRIADVTSRANPLYLAERNQSVNFVKAVQTKYLNSIAWYEFPFSGNNHLDAMVYIPCNQDLDNPLVLLIESKNLRTLTKKIPELADDVHRIDSINAATNGLRKQLDALFPAEKSIKYYGVILCDVQRTEEPHKAIAANWMDGAPNYDELSQLFIDNIKNQTKPNKEDDTDFQNRVSREIETVPEWLLKSIPLMNEYSIPISTDNNVREDYKQLIRYWPIEL